MSVGAARRSARATNRYESLRLAEKAIEKYPRLLADPFGDGMQRASVQLRRRPPVDQIGEDGDMGAVGGEAPLRVSRVSTRSP